MHMWNYVVSAHKPTAVSASVVGHFTSPTETNLIIVKGTRFEVYTFQPEGLQPTLDVPVYGRIAFMGLITFPGETTDSLFLLTERHKCCVLSFDASAGEIRTRWSGDVKDKLGRPTDTGPKGTIDPEFRLIGLHLDDGFFKIIPMDGARLKEAFSVRMEELMTIDVRMLYNCPRPTIALLYQDQREARHLKTYEILIREKEITDGRLAQSNVDRGASLIVPIPPPCGGCVILGEQTITYLDPANREARSISVKATSFKAAGCVDPDGSRYLLGDYMGNLYVLILKHEDGHVKELQLVPLGETSIASSISYLDNGFVFIGSNFGDSQLIQLTSQANENGSYLKELERYCNLGPIVDFVVVDLDRQGQGEIVTCSGAFKEGSLRIIRNGVGIHEHAALEIPGIKGMWSATAGGPFDQYLVLTFIAETRILEINGDQLEETELPGFDHTSQTLFCGNVANGSIVQVTSHSARLIDVNTHQLANEWKPSADVRINVATANSHQLALATSGGYIVYLGVEDGVFTEMSHARLEYEVSCMNLSPLGEADQASVLVVGMWTDATVRVLRLPDLSEMTRDNLDGGEEEHQKVIPRSVMFVTFEGINYLLCALGDGHMFSFKFHESTGALTERKKISLGARPIHINTFYSRDARHIFAASDRPTVIYSGNGKLLYSNVNHPEVTHMCSFNSESFSDSLAIATENILKIGSIDDIQKLHIDTVPLGEQPRRIAHQESTHTFAVCTIQFSPFGTADPERNFLRLLDDQTYEVITYFEFDQNECVCSLLSCKFAGDSTQYYVVGTAFAHADESEPHRGRILVFAVLGQQLVLQAEREENGAVYCLCPFNGKLLAGVNSQLHLHRWQDSDGRKELNHECTHHGHILCLYVKSRGDFILVGDLMRSVSLLVYKALDSSIEEIARDLNSNWMTAVDILDDDTFIGAENSFNLFTARKKSDATTDEERAKLDVVGYFHIGEFVNQFRHGSLVMQLPEAEAPAIPSLIFGTINGVVGIVATLSKERFQFLQKVEKKMETVVQGVGGLRHDQWRSFENERRARDVQNYVDGDLIEQYLDLKREKMEEVAVAVGTSVEELCRRIEELTRLH